MVIQDVRDILEHRGIDPKEHRVLEKPDEDTMCIAKQGKTWLVFYFERGAKRDLQRFQDENAACEYFLAQVLP